MSDSCGPTDCGLNPGHAIFQLSEKAGLKLNIQKTKIMASGPITAWEIDGENVESIRFNFLGLQNQCGW